MEVRGECLIGGFGIRGGGPAFHAVHQASGLDLPETFYSATPADVEEALELASAAFDSYRETSPKYRGAFIDAIASNLMALGDQLLERGSAETGLPLARLESERARTVGQLRLFGREVAAGHFLRISHEPGDEMRRSLVKPDLRVRNVPLGPVAVFGSSNFPLAFSAAGGDTASALAAGCPVVVKAHPAHPGTSELAGRAVQRAALQCGLHPGVYSLLFDAGYETGQALVADRRIRAVGFTGSRRGGLALIDIASKRREPIPVYAEMSSVNPVVVLPDALAKRGDEIAAASVAALTTGAGQFCTNPGLILAIDGPDLRNFIARASERIAEVPPQTMLTKGIHNAYCAALERLSTKSAVTTEAMGPGSPGMNGAAALFSTSALDFLADRELQEETFGPASVVVACLNEIEIHKVLEALEGQLTVAVHISERDIPMARLLVPRLELLAGRLIVNGFGTGVEVSPAMVHGGPFPATSDGRSSSVGTLAVDRFVRPVCYQDFPESLLPKPFLAAPPSGVASPRDTRDGADHPNTFHHHRQ